MTIGIIAFDLNNQYFSDVLIAIENYCSSRNDSTTVMFSHKDANREIACIQNLYHVDVDGILDSTPISHTVPHKLIKRGSV